MKFSEFSTARKESDTSSDLLLSFDFGMHVRNGTTLLIAVPGFTRASDGTLVTSFGSNIDSGLAAAFWDTQLQAIRFVILQQLPDDFTMQVTLPAENEIVTPMPGILTHERRSEERRVGKAWVRKCKTQ